MQGFALEQGDFVARVVDESGIERRYVLGPIFDNGVKAWRILKALEPLVFTSDSYTSRGLYAEAVRKIAIGLRAKGVTSLPKTHKEWQGAIVDLYQYFLKETPGRAALRTRMRIWENAIKPMLESLRDLSKIIPEGVKVPPNQRQRPDRRPNFSKSTLASGKTTTIKSAQQIAESSALLLDLDLSKTDAEYLEGFRDRLIAVRAALDADCVWYVTSMAEHFAYGQQMLKMCSEAEGRALKRKYESTSALPYRAMHKALEQDCLPGKTEISFARILRLFQMEDAKPKMKLKEIFMSPWLPGWQSVNFPPGAPAEPFPASPSMTRRFRWMLGLIDVADICMVHLLLSLRNPRFNAVPLFDAKLRGKHGNMNFTFTVDGKAFSVNKRRAGARKASTLDEESILALNTILQMTKAVRDQMARSNPLKNRLFFVSSYSGARGVRYQSLYQFVGDGGGGRKLADIMPRTAATELPPSNVVPKRLRRTHAVLEWFKTGSVLKAAKHIGNSTRVVIKHYIPEALLDAWNIRQIRRFQNLWLATATAGESYSVSATDFASQDDLKKFIDEMLKEHNPSSSRLAAKIHERFRNPEQHSTPSQPPKATDPSSLVIGVNATNLAVLYAFRDVAYETGMGTTSKPTGKLERLTDEAAIDLADLLTTRLPDHHDPKIRKAHAEALALAQSMAAAVRAGAYMTATARR
jgi:hypothetical protein